LDHLSELEHKTIYVVREAYSRFRNIGMLWSIGKDSTSLLWICRKAFFGKVPFPVIHIDTGHKFKEIYAFRDRYAKEWGLDLRVAKNDAALAAGMGPDKGAKLDCCHALKTQALKEFIAREKLDAILLGIRRDEHGIRAKERYFSPRDRQMEWNVEDQPPEFWDQFQTDVAPGTHIRIHPLLHWTELNIWEYIEREKVPVIPLYFANERGERYRSIGCYPCTFPVKSSARTVAEIVAELRQTRTPERAGRAQDQESEAAFEQLRRDGYM